MILLLQQQCTATFPRNRFGNFNSITIINRSSIGQEGQAETKCRFSFSFFLVNWLYMVILNHFWYNIPIKQKVQNVYEKTICKN